MRNVLLVLMFLLHAVVAMGQTTREDIDVPPHDLAVLSVPKVAGESVVWSFLLPLDRRFESFQVEDAHRCVFVSGDVGQQFVVEAAVINWDQRTFKKRLWLVTSVDDGAPPPPPPPPPPPGGVPDGAFGLTKLSYQNLSLVPEPQRTRRRESVANNFREASKSTEQPATMLQKLQTANRETLGEDREAWLPWFQAWSQAVTAAQTSGAMRTVVADYQKACAATADGLMWAGAWSMMP